MTSTRVLNALVSGRKLRVRRFDRHETEYGYVGRYRHHYQALEVKRWWGWKQVAVEEVPAHVLIGIGATGYDASKWQSAFTVLGRFGRDGILVPRSVHSIA